MRLFTFWWSFSRACPLPPINNVENILFDKPWLQNRFNNIAQGGGGARTIVTGGRGPINCLSQQFLHSIVGLVHMSTVNQESYLSCERGLNYFLSHLIFCLALGQCCVTMPFNTIQPIQKKLSFANSLNSNLQPWTLSTKSLMGAQVSSLVVEYCSYLWINCSRKEIFTMSLRNGPIYDF
jgi:hypothetical protein